MNTRPEKIIQFGEGGFLRGFFDWILQHLNEKTDFNGSAVIVQPIEKGLCDKLSEQNCTYTHVCRGAEGVVAKKIDSISRCVKVYDEFDKYMKLAENKDFRFIVSNTTESGIAYCPTDTPDMTPPTSFPAKVTLLLKRRFDLGLDGFVFLPCELIDKNGQKLKEIILRYASEWSFGDKFINWINNENIFCNTLVDRIVPGYPRGEKILDEYPDPMLNTSEYFHLWVIEGYKDLSKELPMDVAGINAVITDNLEKYRTLKVRILNGAHTSMVHYALLEGLETVKECMDSEKISTFLKKCVFEQIIPTLDSDKEETEEYANNVLIRFSNPHIRHYLMSITLNSVSKFRVRVLPSILEYIKRFDKIPTELVFSLAKLIEYYRTREANDDIKIMEFMKTATVDEILSNTDLWETDLSFLGDEVKKYVN